MGVDHELSFCSCFPLQSLCDMFCPPYTHRENIKFWPDQIALLYFVAACLCNNKVRSATTCLRVGSFISTPLPMRFPSIVCEQAKERLCFFVIQRNDKAFKRSTSFQEIRKHFRAQPNLVHLQSQYNNQKLHIIFRRLLRKKFLRNSSPIKCLPSAEHFNLVNGRFSFSPWMWHMN